MADGVDEVENVLITDIAPASRPRDQRGKYIRETTNPEPLFKSREIEGPRAMEVRSGDEQSDQASSETEGEGGEHRVPDGPRRDNADADDGYDLVEGEPENIAAKSESDSADDEDEGQKYEVTVDGQSHEVTLAELQRGYIREATFHQRLAQLNEREGQLEGYDRQLRQNWAIWDKAIRDYEEDFIGLLPKEPNWDEEFARDSHEAYRQQKIFQILYGKLAQVRQDRAQREAYEQQERDRLTQKYAIDGFNKFVMKNIKLLRDKPSMERHLNSMRRTALSLGFNDYEVSTIFDPRMLDTLLMADRYVQMTRDRPNPVVAGKGRTLTPGAATPGIGNGRRKGFDDAQRQLARTGRIDDATEVFRRFL